MKLIDRYCVAAVEKMIKSMTAIKEPVVQVAPMKMRMRWVGVLSFALC